MGEFSFVEMWQKMGILAKGVNIFLIIMSLYSLGVIIERLLTYSAGSRQSLSYVLALRDFVSMQLRRVAREVPQREHCCRTNPRVKRARVRSVQQHRPMRAIEQLHRRRVERTCKRARDLHRVGSDMRAHRGELEFVRLVSPAIRRRAGVAFDVVAR